MSVLTSSKPQGLRWHDKMFFIQSLPTHEPRQGVLKQNLIWLLQDSRNVDV